MATTTSNDRATTTSAPAETGSGWHWTGAASSSAWLASAAELGPALAARAADHDESGEYVAPSMAAIRERGLLGMLVPVELGGGGASHAEACAVLAELARHCPASSLTLSMHLHLLAAQVWRHNRGLAAPVLAKVAAQQLQLVSTGAADWIGSSGAARPVDGGFLVTATKGPASGCPSGDVLVTSVRWEDAPDGPAVLHLSLPLSAAGVSVRQTWNTLGMRGTGSDTVELQEVFVPDEAIALSRPAGEWHPVWAVVLGVAMPLIMASYVGLAEAAVDEATQLAVRRAERPETATTVGRMTTALVTARDMVRAMIDGAADLRFEGTIEHASVTLARRSAAGAAVLDAVQLAMEAAGGGGFDRSGRIERLFRDAQGVRYHPLPSASQERFSGRVALGLDPLG